LVDIAQFVCQHKRPIANLNSNDDIFSRAVWNLLVILSKWPGSSGSRRQHGLTLELGACSPSDSKHTFRDFHLEHNYPYQEEKDLETQFKAYKLRADALGLDSLNDPHHGWMNGHWEGVSLEAKQRIMGTLTINSNLPAFSAFSQKFPKVDIVTGLLIRRQFCRKIAASSLGMLLSEAFTCLQWFRHEAWHDVNPQEQLCFEKSTLKSYSLPDAVVRIQIHVGSTLTNLLLQTTRV
jgi:hypothetical protein